MSDSILEILDTSTIIMMMRGLLETERRSCEHFIKNQLIRNKKLATFDSLKSHLDELERRLALCAAGNPLPHVTPYNPLKPNC
jgi:hypothetical protein